MRTEAPTSALTLNDILEAKRKIGAIPYVPVLPILQELPWPMIQIRHHRKRRIDKKWLKRYGTRPWFGADRGEYYTFVFNGQPVIAAYPQTFKILQKWQHNPKLTGAANE